MALAAVGVLAVVTQVLVAYAATLAPPAQRGRIVGIVTSGVVLGILGGLVVLGHDRTVDAMASGGFEIDIEFSAQRLRELESENAKLKRLLAEAHLDMHALKSVLGVKR